MQYTQEELNKMLELHKKWLNNEKNGEKLDLSFKNLNGASLNDASLVGASLVGANLNGASLNGANLNGANLNDASLNRANLNCASLNDASLNGANLNRASLVGANLNRASLVGANLNRASLVGANLNGASLDGANLNRASLNDASLVGASLNGASLDGANLNRASLDNVKNLIKLIGVEVGNYYWKRIDESFSSNGYYFTVGLNKLQDGEIFANDERVLCSYPGFHFASRSWCAKEYNDRKYEVKIQIPKGAEINEPWATDGKASANMIKIVQVIDSETGKDVTKKFKNYADGKGNKLCEII